MNDPCDPNDQGPCFNCINPNKMCLGICGVYENTTIALNEDLGFEEYVARLMDLNHSLRCARRLTSGNLFCAQHARSLQPNNDLFSEYNVLTMDEESWINNLTRIVTPIMGWSDLVLQILESQKQTQYSSVGVWFRLCLNIMNAMLILNPYDKLPLMMRLPSQEEDEFFNQLIVEKTAPNFDLICNVRCVVQCIKRVQNNAYDRMRTYEEQQVSISSLIPEYLLDMVNVDATQFQLNSPIPQKYDTIMTDRIKGLNSDEMQGLNYF